MVSKINRITTKPTKPRRTGRRRSPIKHVAAVSSAVLSSIHRRLTKFFNKLTRIAATPNRRNKGYYSILLKKPLLENDDRQEEESQNRTLFFPNPNSPLPPLISPHRRTIFLDLDETLVHSKPEPPPARFDFVVRPKIDGETMNFYVLKRPGVDDLIEFLTARFEVVVFTAALEGYASMVLDRVDPNCRISHRLYRNSCSEFNGTLVKDLAEMGRDLKRVVIVDDNPNSYAKQPENAIPIRPFINDLGDRELWKLIEFFEASDRFDDMRDAVRHYIN